MPPRRTDHSARVIAAIASKLGPRVVHAASALDGVTEVVPFGIGPLDHYVCGCGGLPVGRLTEMFAEEGTGKSSLALAVIAQTQKMGGTVILAKSEDDPLVDRAKVFGVDLDKLVLVEDGYLEQYLLAWEVAMQGLSGGPHLVVLDSFAASRTKAEVEDGVSGDAAVADRARIMSRAMRILPPIAKRKRCAMLLVNQTRHKIGVVYGNKTTTPGGDGIKFHASLRLQMFPGKSQKEGTGHVGKNITVMAVKTRFSPPYRKASLRLTYATGWDDQWATVNFAKDCGALPDKTRVTESAYAEAVERLTACGWSPAGVPVTPEARALIDEFGEEAQDDSAVHGGAEDV